MSLDASKAFDRVKLYPLVIRFLINMYILQSMCVSWENESFNFVTSNGVKQCGVLLPILYGIYNDAYADDVVLLCPTKTGLSKMLNICKQFSCNMILILMLTNQNILCTRIFRQV